MQGPSQNFPIPAMASLVNHMLNYLPATVIQSLGQEDSLEEGIATHPSILARGNPMERGAWRATVHGVAKSDLT